MKKPKLKLICLLLAASLLLSACNSSQEIIETNEVTISEGRYTAGTYQSSSSGMNGDVVLAVTFTEQTIEDIQIIEHQETDGIADPALEELPATILNAQSVDVDTISSATITSKAILAAVQDCINQAMGITSSDNGYLAGTYLVNVNAHNGDMAVSVTFTEDKIETIEVTHVETDGIGTAAIDLLSERIIENQTLKLDAISSATVTSQALLSAVSDAVILAGGNVRLLNGDITLNQSQSTPIQKTADVVVIGAGGAGMAAATVVSESGGSVIIIEKMEFIGGNTIRAGGTLNAVDPERQAKIGIEDSVDNFYENIMSGGDYQSIPELARVLAENSMDARQWLEDRGTQWSEVVYLTIGGLFTRSMDVKDKNTYQGFIEPLLTIIEEHDGEIILNCEAQELIVDDNGNVIGVFAIDTKNNQKYEIFANNGVVIATGGYGASSDMVSKYNNLSDLPTSNTSAATGDGINMALAAGAALEGMDYIQIHPHGNPLTGGLQSHFAGDVTNAIYVNKEGNRFVNEQGRRDDISNATIEQTEQIMFSIFDSECDVYPGTPKYSGMDEMISKNYVYKADTLAELAEMVGIDADGLLETVEQYNTLVQAGVDTDFNKSIIEKEIGVGPFYCVPLSPTIHHTMGGIKIDTLTRVLDNAGNPISGLYACGEVTGGIHGSNRIGGNAITDCFVFGRIAGESAFEQK